MAQVRQLYREMLKTARLLPDGQALPAIQEIRTKFRQNMNETDKEKINASIHEAEGRLKFWKMITPRRQQATAENTVYRVDEKGNLVEGHGEFAKTAKLSHFGMVTDEMRYINEQQMRRMSYLPYKKRI